MNFFNLPSGRVVFQTYYNDKGYPVYYEYFDTKSGAIRLAKGQYWDGSDKSRSEASAATLADFYELIEWIMETHQMLWWSDPRNDKLITFRYSFGWLAPRVGDQLKSRAGRTYTVVHVPKGLGQTSWNLSVLLDSAPVNKDPLQWVGEARARNLIDFHADYGHPDTPTPGEASAGDTGVAYNTVLRPTITYLLVRQEAYTLRGSPFGSTKELVQRTREYITDPKNPQRQIEVLAQRMDNLIKFSCIHPRAGTADALAEWLKRCLNRNRDTILKNGIGQFLFWSASNRERKTKNGDDLVTHEVSYYAVTEEIEVNEVSTLKKLKHTFNVALSGDSDVPSEPGWLTPYTGITDESGNLLWGTNQIQDYGTTGSL